MAPSRFDNLVNFHKFFLVLNTLMSRCLQSWYFSRMTLLLGPPGSGKSTLLQALAGKLDKDLRVTGKVTYCGHEMNEFVPQRTCAYISQHDLHHGELTVRETLDFSGRCSGVGTRYEMLAELSRREKAEGIKPDPELDAFMKAIAVSGQKSSLVTEYVLRVLFFVSFYTVIYQLNIKLITNNLTIMIP